MKKLTLLCPVSAVEQTVRELQHVGVVHLDPVRPPEGDTLDRSRREWVAVRELIDKVPWDSDCPPSGLEAQAVTDEIRRLLKFNAQQTEALEKLKEQYQAWLPFGEFNPESVLELQAKGCFVGFFAIPLKSSLEVPEGAALVEAGKDRQSRFVVLFSTEEIRLNDARQLAPAEFSLSQLKERIADTEASIESNKRLVQRFAGDRERVLDHARDLKAALECREAELGMGTEGPVAFLRGYFPAKRESEIVEAAVQGGWGYAISDPEDDDEPPTLIENPRWVRPIEPVFNLIGVTPGYRETDISIPFLVFFSLFFAMLVGDAGYGLILLILTLLAKWRFSNLPRPLFSLLFVTSGATFLWGVMDGNYFSAQRLPAILENLQLPWLTGDHGDDNLMLLCFFIGALHLTLAHVWTFVRTLNSLQAIAQIGWTCMTWAMFFAARALVLGYPFPQATGYLLGIAVFLIIPFMTPLKQLKKQWLGHVMLPFKLVSNFVDVVSYVRLFAVGTATYAVASAFNQMALGNGVDSLTSTLGAVVILFLGHTLNLLLAAMAVLVHGIRLNMLEFASHMDLQMNGIRYYPFSR